jgi:hypothetical protein
MFARDTTLLRPAEGDGDTKLLHFASNIGGLLAFAPAGVVVWKIALMMGAGQFLGARLGVALAIRKGARTIRPMLLVASIALALRPLADPAQPLRAWLGW